MPSRNDRPAPPLIVAVVALLAAGIGVTLLIFHPGVMTFDAKFVYEDIAKGTMGDWQSPVMVWLWALIDPLAPGAGSMFLFTVASYWLGFGILSLALAVKGKRSALLLPLLALSPPALVLAGVIWRDVLLAALWLLAAAIVFAVPERGRPIRRAGQGLALAVITLGVLLRPNALLAAPVLMAYAIFAARLSLRKAIIVFVPAAVVSYGVVQFVYYGLLDARRQHPLQTIMIYDLGGISHFSKQNQFPVQWSDAETEKLLNGCYQPTMWDIYWRLEPCDFVMRKVEREAHLFGTPAIPKAWLASVMRHPVAYLQHRSAFMWNFLAGDNLVMWTADVERFGQNVFPDRAIFNALVRVQDALKPTPVFRPVLWLLACMILCGLALRRQPSRETAFALGVCGSAAIYVISFYAVGVASDYRYGYWAVLAGLAGGVVLLSGASTRQD